ncbi:UBX domain-containing protein 11 isoform X2 [Melanerpes formicivorus]|uniref:UBX domain-containing protein 11 isoform X2 n=1 Tax=Melanerpes formicivorus TaxID=211600 RepID=UPI00358FF18C
MQDAACTEPGPLSFLRQRLTLLEQKIEEQTQEIQGKDRRIAELEEKLKALQEEAAPHSSTAEGLGRRCLQLQSQVWQMECFLNDYGLIWVGEGHKELEDADPGKDEGELPARSFWKPGEAVVSQHQIDFDLILAKVKDLNLLAGEGIPQIQLAAGGAQLRQPEALPLTLYQNGMVLAGRPFQPYQHPATQQCLQDIIDGYFPSELQLHYPDGIPLQVTDRRDVVFQERDLPGRFPGPGQVVGRSRPSEVQDTPGSPGPKLSLEQFLKKLPKPSAPGEATRVQDSARAVQQGSGGVQSSKENLQETPRLPGLERLEGAEAAGCRLRVRPEGGERSQVLRLLPTDTIGDLRRRLAASRVYVDDSRSLQECGLTPSACLLLRSRDLSPRGGAGLHTA